MMQKLKNIAVFLDIDGVINHYGNDENLGKTLFIDTRCLVRLNKILHEVRKTHTVHLVISSTWRQLQPVDSFRFWLRRLGLWEFDSMGMTRKLGTIRGKEIKEWMDSSSFAFDDYIILDDDCDMLREQASHHIHTNTFMGFTDTDAKRMAMRLGVDYV